MSRFKHFDHKGRFRSDKYPFIPPDSFLLKFDDPIAQPSIRLYAENTPDKDLARDLLERLDRLEKDSDG